MTNEINQLDYESTMTKGMADVTETAEPVVDIWPYVEMLVSEGIVSPYAMENDLVEKVYRSKDNRYDHILLPTERQNYFVVLIVDISAKIIVGYRLLDLNKLYT